jgi:hypothetical protein
VLHELPPPRTGRSGRPPTRGARLGTPDRPGRQRHSRGAVAHYPAPPLRTHRRRADHRTGLLVVRTVSQPNRSGHSGATISRALAIVTIAGMGAPAGDHRSRIFRGRSGSALCVTVGNRAGLRRRSPDRRCGRGPQSDPSCRGADGAVRVICFSVVTVWYALHGPAPDDVWGSETWHTLRPAVIGSCQRFGMIAPRVTTAALLDLPAGARTGPADEPHVLHQGRRAPGASASGRRAPPHQRQTTHEPGGPGDVRRPCPAATPTAAGPTAWSPQARSCAGIATSCGGDGPTRADQDGHRSTTSSPRWWSAWRGRTRAGDTGGSKVSCRSPTTATPDLCC